MRISASICLPILLHRLRDLLYDTVGADSRLSQDRQIFCSCDAHERVIVFARGITKEACRGRVYGEHSRSIIDATDESARGSNLDLNGYPGANAMTSTAPGAWARFTSEGK